MLIFGEKRTVVPDPLPLAYAVYAFINVDNCERPLSDIDKQRDMSQRINLLSPLAVGL